MNNAERLKLLYHPRIWLMADEFMPFINKSRPFVVQKDYIANDLAIIIVHYKWANEHYPKIIHDIIYNLQRYFDARFSPKTHAWITERIMHYLTDSEYNKPEYRTEETQ